jgi:hypothetical protein
MNPYARIKEHESRKKDTDDCSATIVVRLTKGEKYSNQFDNNALVLFSEKEDKTEIFVNGQSVVLSDLTAQTIELDTKQSSFLVDIEATTDTVIHIVCVELKKEKETKLKKEKTNNGQSKKTAQ